jgi:hypothetical protein
VGGRPRRLAESDEPELPQPAVVVPARLSTWIITINQSDAQRECRQKNSTVKSIEELRDARARMYGSLSIAWWGSRSADFAEQGRDAR